MQNIELPEQEFIVNPNKYDGPEEKGGDETGTEKVVKQTLKEAIHDVGETFKEPYSQGVLLDGQELGVKPPKSLIETDKKIINAVEGLEADLEGIIQQ